MKIMQKTIIKNGNEYLVYIRPHETEKYIWVVDLYKPNSYKLFNLFPIDEKLLRKNFGLEQHRYIYTDVEYLINLDFKYMAEKVIEIYENENTDKLKFKKDLSEAIDNFNKWDGIIK